MTARGARRSQTAPGRDELERATEIGSRLVVWYERHGRDFSWRGDTDPFRVAVTEVLLQRTRAETIERFVDSFLAAYPSAGVLASTPVEELERALGPIGLQHRRAASLKALAEGWDRNPASPWETRPGVGQYVAPGNPRRDPRCARGDGRLQLRAHAPAGLRRRVDGRLPVRPPAPGAGVSRDRWWLGRPARELGGAGSGGSRVHPSTALLQGLPARRRVPRGRASDQELTFRARRRGAGDRP